MLSLVAPKGPRMTLKDFQALGAYVNAGFLDVFYNGKHTRLARVTVDGDLLMLPAGDAFVAGLPPAKPKKAPPAKES